MTILITGGSSGIGRAIADECAANGHNLILVARNRARLERTKKEILKEHVVDIQVITADIAVDSQVKKVKEFCQKHTCLPDALVMNAGIFIPRRITQAKPEDIEKIMATNVYSIMYFVRAFASTLKKRTNPKIILIGSTAGIEPHKSMTTGSLYSTTKWAVRGLAANLRKELMADEIGVTFVAPGSVMTEMWGSDAQPKKMLEAADIGKLVATILTLSPQAVVEEIVVRPMHGNI